MIDAVKARMVEMKNTVGVSEAQRQFGAILKDVSKGAEYVVDDHGESIAAVIPFYRYQQMERDRERNRKVFFERARQAAERANLSEEEATRLVDEAIRAVRAYGWMP